MKLKCHIKQKSTKFRESLKALQLARSLTALTCTLSQVTACNFTLLNLVS